MKCCFNFRKKKPNIEKQLQHVPKLNLIYNTDNNKENKDIVTLYIKL